MDRGLYALVGAAAAPPATDPLVAPATPPTAAQLRDACFVMAANAGMFGVGLIALTEHMGGGKALLKTGAVLLVPSLLFAAANEG